MIEDAELLRRYAANRREADFAEVVRRHLDLVYSAALRQVNGDAHLAQDVTQAVFVDLARKAAEVAHHRVLAGWLFTSARFAAANAVRGERRRRAREAEAHLMQELTRDPTAPADWARVRPVLDEVLAELGAADREAILLRFFEGRGFAEVGKKLSVNENAARMRVERALDKLRAGLEQRGVSSTSAALAAVLANQAVIAAPAGLAAIVTSAAIAGAGAAATGGGIVGTFMSMTKLQVGIAGALVAAGTTGYLVQARSNAALRDEIAGLRAENASLTAAKAEQLALSRASAEVADMRNDDAELARLSTEAAALKARLQQVARAEQARSAAGSGEIYEVGRLDRMPRPTAQARPQYPAELRRVGITGAATVEFMVDENGTVQNARAVRSSLSGKDGGTVDAVVLQRVMVAGSASEGGEPKLSADAAKLFEEAAVAAVSQWKFTPGQKGGQNVKTRMQVPIGFALSGEKIAPSGPRVIAPNGAMVNTPDGTAVVDPKR